MFLEIKIIKEQEEVFDMMEHKVKNAKVGEKRRLVFSVHGMIEKKENGIWEKDNAEVQFLGGSAVFAARSIYCQTPPVVCPTKDERCTTCDCPSRAASSNRRQMIQKETKNSSSLTCDCHTSCHVLDLTLCELPSGS